MSWSWETTDLTLRRESEGARNPMAPKRQISVEAASPPEKRLQAAAPGGGGGPETPPSRRQRFLSIALVVLFLKRPKTRSSMNTTPISVLQLQLGRLVREQFCHFFNPRFSKLESKLESIEERIQDLTQKVDNITKCSPDRYNHDRPMPAPYAKQEGTIAEAEGLSSTEGRGKNTSIRLRFLNGMKIPVYHDDEVKSDGNSSIKLGIFDGDKMIESGSLSSVQVEIFALEGDFPHASPKSWTAKKIKKHRANCRDGKGNVLVGEGTIAQLNNGQCDLGSIKFREGSCKARGGKFIIAARVCDGEISGVQIQEAVMNPVVVLDRRNKTNEKRHLPMLDDKVHRLEGIAKDGIYCKRLEAKNIFTVRDFLKALNKDPDNLAKVLKLQKGSRGWKKMIEHSKKCCLNRELTLYCCMERNTVLFFNCVHDLVGAEFGGHYTARDKFDSDQQDLVDGLKGSAYDQLDALVPDHVMTGTDNFPRPVHTDIGAAGPSYMPSGRSDRLAGVPGGEGPSYCYTQVEPSIVNMNSNPGPSCFISDPDHYNAHAYQVQETWLAGPEQFSSASNDWTTEELYCSDGHESQTGTNQMENQSQLFSLDNDILGASTSSQGYMISTQQPTFGGGLGSTPGSMQAPSHPSNVTPEVLSLYGQLHQAQQWSQFQGGIVWDGSL